MRDAEVLDEFRELVVCVGQVGQFVGGGSHEINQVLVRGQEAVLDHSGDGDLEGDRAERTLVPVDVLPELSVKVGRGGGETDNDRALEQILGVGQNPPPVTQQVVALVENNQADPDVLEPTQCFDRRAMQRPHRLSAERKSIR